MDTTNEQRREFALWVEELEDRVAPSRAGSPAFLNNNDEQETWEVISSWL